MRKSTYTLLFLLLFSPLLSYLYVAVLQLPKTLYHFFVFLFLVYGMFFLLNKRKIVYPKFIFLLFFYAIYRLFWLQISGQEYHQLTSIYYAIYNFSTILLIIVIYNTIFSDRFIRYCIQIIKITIILAASVSIVQVFLPEFLNPWEYNLRFFDINSMYKSRRQSIFGFVESNEIGLSFMPLAAVLIGYILRFKKQNYMIFSILIGITAFLTNSRYVMVSFLIMIFQYLVYYRHSISFSFKYVVIVVFIIFSLAISLDYLGYDFKEFYEVRLLAEGSLTETTRFRAIQNFSYFFPKHMMWGTGVHLTDDIERASKAIGSSQIHVGYLSHLVSYGIVGSLLLFGFWFSLAKHLYLNAKRTNYWGSFFAFLIFY